MIKSELSDLLTESCLFEPEKIAKILATTGTYTVGNAIVACEIIGIRLYGNDIDVLIAGLIDAENERINND